MHPNVKNLPGFTPPHLMSGLPEDSAVLLGFSGGADSRALLHLLSGYCAGTGARLYTAHVDHGIRGAEAVRDREFCRRVASEYGVECFVTEADVPALAHKHRESLETEARRVRYEFFDSLMREHCIPLLATAHNADDNLETLIFNISRGCGLRGMGAIPPARRLGCGLLIRPLLGVPKADIESYCKENRLEYVVDSTNADDRYSRNLIRHRIVPPLRELNSGLSKNIARLTAAARTDCDFIEGEVESYFARLGEDASRLPALAALHPALRVRVLARLYGDASGRIPEEVHLADLLLLCERGVPHSALSLPGLVRAQVEDGKLVFVRDPRKEYRHL